MNALKCNPNFEIQCFSFVYPIVLMNKSCYIKEHKYINPLKIHGVTVITLGNVHGDPSSNPGWCCLHFTWH